MVTFCPEGAGPEMLWFENKTVFDVQQSYIFPPAVTVAIQNSETFFFFIPTQHKTTSNWEETGAGGPKRHV